MLTNTSSATTPSRRPRSSDITSQSARSPFIGSTVEDVQPSRYDVRVTTDHPFFLGPAIKFDPAFVMLVDANSLLEFYKHLDPAWEAAAKKLASLARSIFITQQIVDEVERCKLNVTKQVLQESLGELSVPRPKLPPGLQGHADALNRACADLTAGKERVRNSAQQHLEAVGRSEDEVSRALQPVFLNAVPPSEEALKKARMRREQGNPPGKPKDPLGDQVTWEQLLEYVGEDTRVVWIVTSDADYFTPTFNKDKLLLNPKLRQELSRAAPNADIRIARGLIPAINSCLGELGREEDQFREEQLAHFERLAEDEESRREPWQCSRDHDNTPILSICCVGCGEDIMDGLGEEDYRVRHVQGGQELTLFPDNKYSDVLACPNCEKCTFEIDFDSLCSYCQGVWDSYE